MLRDSSGRASRTAIEIEAAEDYVQSLALPNMQRAEGIAFSSSGNIIGVATPDTNAICMFRRNPNGRFDDTPYWIIQGPGSGLDYPHDLSFSRSGKTELLAVAQRLGSITIYEKSGTRDHYEVEPVFTICGPETRLNFSDGVAFVPPRNDQLAACNLLSGTISFYRKRTRHSNTFVLEPVFELELGGACQPDGLAFSQDGDWLAVANHGNHTVSIFRRRSMILARGSFKYGPEPAAIIEDPGLRYPHSVAFTPRTNHLVVTNAGANYFNVYAPIGRGSKTLWSQSPVLQQTIGPDSVFKEVNATNKMEGGPKGVATHENNLAVSSPEHGVKIYWFREGLSAS